jgi:hypothetical protein
MNTLDHANQYADEMRRGSQLEGAFVHSCRAFINNRRLSACDSNRAVLESLLNPGEEPSAKLYLALAEQYQTKFAWETPEVQPTKEEQRAAFDLLVREHNLSSCEANFQLFQQGARTENFAGASQIERAQYAHEAAQARQKFLIHDATPSELKVEAAYESQTNHDAAVQAEADRRHQFVSDQQRGLYTPLPAVNGNGEAMDSKYFRRISTVDYNLFKTLVKRYGSSQITSRLRGEN